MGQKIGKATLIEEVEPFTNLPRRAIANLWQVFNNVADGFGVSTDELEEICSDLKDELNITRVSILEKTSALFKSYDTDKNGLIDALEFFASISILSGMRKQEIVEFILTIYDFDGSQTLSLDEVVLALKSACVGLCKIQTPNSSINNSREKVSIAKEEQIEQLVSYIFNHSSIASTSESKTNNNNTNNANKNTSLLTKKNEFFNDDSTRLSIKLLCSLLSDHPDICYWYEYFHAPSQNKMENYISREVDIDYEFENQTVDRTLEESKAIDWNVMAITEKKEYSATENPWISPVAMLTPIIYTNGVTRKDTPDTSMAPEWVYGYQSERVKNNVSYTYSGDLVYTVSRYAVVYNFKSNSQKIFSGHTEEIICFKMHPNKQLIATGESGPSPRLLVWNSENQHIVYASERNLHSNGILHVCFSLDGKLLLSIGNDKQHSLNVINWEKNTLLYTSTVHTGSVRCATILANNTLVVAGEKFIYFYSKNNTNNISNYVKRAGIYSKFTTLQCITSVEPIYGTDNLVSGTVAGNLMLWVDINCVRVVKGHNGAICSLYSYSHGLLSGGKDCRIRMWTTNLEPGFTFDVSHYGINANIRALNASADGTTILFGTRGSNIFEISAIDGSDLRGGPIAVGHSFGSLNCLAVHPSKFEFITVGSDHTLRIFDMNTKTQLKVATFDGDALATTYSPLGDVIVVGFGGVGAKCGSFAVLSEETFDIIHEAKDSSQAVTAVMYSSEGETLAIGTSDGSIFLYSVLDEYEMVAKCTRHAAPVLFIDFSADGEWIRSNSLDKELCFFNSDDGNVQSNIAAMRDVIWASNNCIYSWHNKAIHRSVYNNEQITCANVPLPSANTTGSKDNYVACGSNIGYIQLKSFPCIDDTCELIRYPAHCDAISGIKFSFDATKLISIGKTDRCIIQWNCFPYTNSNNESAVTVNVNAKSAKTEEKSEDLLLETRSGEQMKSEFLHPNSILPIGKINGLSTDQVELISTPDNDVWLVKCIEPTVQPTIHTNVPQMSVILQHVYGYESQFMRNNVRYSSNGDIVYVTSTMGVVLDRTNLSQKIYKFHSDCITSFASSNDGQYIATGQMGHNANVSIWNAKNCKTLFILPETQLYSVCCIAFSSDNQYIAVVSNDVNHTISVYNWIANVSVCKMYGGANHILGVLFTNNTDSNGNAVLNLVSYGVHEIKFWEGVNTRFPTAFKPVLGEVGVMQTFLCGAVFANCATIGTSDGNLYIFDSFNLKHAVKAHNGSVNAIHCNNTNTSAGSSNNNSNNNNNNSGGAALMTNLLVTGGRDGAIRIWNTSHECIKEYSIDAIITSFNPKVRSVAFSADGTRIVIGTRGCEIFEISVKEGKLLHGKPLVEFHGNRQLSGLSSHPVKEEFATAGDDATLRIWDARQYLPIKSIKLDTPSRAVSYSPDGKYLAIGFGNGKRTKGKLAPKEGAFTILKTADYKIVFEGKDSNNFIKVLKWSPDGKFFAIGSEDTCIYLYNAKDNFSKRVTLRCHGAPVCSLDFNSEGTFLMSTDTAKRLCFSDVMSGTTIPTPETLRDEKWSTTTAAIGWHCLGFWLMQASGKIEPVTAQKSWGGLLLATGNTAGQVSIAHNPVPMKSGFLQLNGHCGAVTNLAWIAGDGTLLSSGVNDHTVLQWKCIYDATRESGDEGGRSGDDSETEFDCGHEKHLQNFTPKFENVSGAAERVKDVVVHEAPAQEETAVVTVPAQKWLSIITPPSDLPYEDMNPLTKPVCDLEFIHGARVSDCRQNIKYNCEDNLVYVVSTFGVIYNRNAVQQLFYSGHKYAVISLELNHTADIAATGDLCLNPEIHLWDARTAKNITKFSNIHTQGVSSLSFSRSSDYLVALGQDVQNSVVVFHSPSKLWVDGFVISSFSTTISKMLWVNYSENNAFPIVVGGAGGVLFYRLVRNNNERLKGTFGKRIKIQPVLCAVTDHSGGITGDINTESAIVTGTVSGHLYIFQNCKVANKISAHDTAVYAVGRTKLGYISGSKGGEIKIWTEDFAVLYTYKTMNWYPKPNTMTVHSLACNMAGTTFVSGIKSGEVFEISIASKTHSLLLESHSTAEVHGLDVNPANSDEYVTVGDDGWVKIWSIARKYCICKQFIEFPSRAVAWSPKGDKIVLGMGTGQGGGNTGSKDGAFLVLNAMNLEIIREDRKAKQFITDIKFSHSTNTLAFAAGDGRVYVHESVNFGHLKTIDTGTKNAVATKIDFSADGNVISVALSTKELFFYDVQQSLLINSPMIVRDVVWQSLSNPYTWNTQGVFDRNLHADVMAVAVNRKASVVAVSYNNGCMRLYRYPCQSTMAPFQVLKGVGSKATRLTFTSDGKYLLVVDSLLRSVLQFIVN